MFFASAGIVHSSAASVGGLRTSDLYAGTGAVAAASGGASRVAYIGGSAPPTWTDPVVPPSGTAPGTTVTTVTVSNVTPYSTCLTVSLTGSSPTPTAWQFSIDYSEPPYYGVQPTVDSHAIIGASTGSVISLHGTSNGNSAWEEWGNNSLLTNARTLAVLVCVYNVGTAPDRPEAYTASPQVHGATWSSTKACVRRAITGNGIYPFYFGWATSFDLAEAIALLKTNDAGAPRAFQYQANPTAPGSYTAGTSTYAMTSYRDNEVSGTGSVVAELCVVQY